MDTRAFTWTGRGGPGVSFGEASAAQYMRPSKRRHRPRGLFKLLSRLLCRHSYRPSRSWPGVAVCRKCGVRRRVRWP